MDRHNFSFFGQKTALILDSGPLNEPSIYVRLIKKLPSGIWEKPSKKEGKSLKFNLLEMTEILHVLQTPNSSWSTVHRFKQQQSSIKFDRKEATLQMFTKGYSKFFNKAEVTVLKDLLNHIYEEKIQFATGNNERSRIIPNSEKHKIKSQNTKPLQNSKKQIEKSPSYTTNPGSTNPTIPQSTHKFLENPEKWLETLQKDAEYCMVPGKIMVKRDKALSYAVTDKAQIWVPLSQVKTNSDHTKTNLWIKEWFLKIKLEE
ncbi:MAG: hypothetical protein ACTSYU_12190, partial [Promethearchaeota archaeon]